MKLNVPTMACGGCAATIENAVKALDPLATVEANPTEKTVSVTTGQSAETITKAVAASGYPVTTVN